MLLILLTKTNCLAKLVRFVKFPAHLLRLSNVCAALHFLEVLGKLLLALVISRFSKFECFRTESIIFADQLLAFFRIVPLAAKPLLLYEVHRVMLMSLWPSVDRGAVGEKFMGPPRTDLPRLVFSHRFAAWTNKTVRGCRVGRGKPTNVNIC